MTAKKSSKKKPPVKAKPAVDDVKIPGERELKKKEAAKVKGLFDQLVYLPFDYMADHNERWKLSGNEKKYLSDATGDVAAELGVDRLEKDPWLKFAIVVGVIVVPRILMEIRDAIREQKKHPKPEDEGKSKPDHTDTGKKGPGQDSADYDGIPPSSSVGPIDSI